MRKSLGLMAALAAAVMLTGCFEVEQSIHLEKDRSGTASFAMTVNLEGMAIAMAQMQHSMSGKTGELTAAEIDEAKKSFAATRKEETKDKEDEFTAKKAAWEKTLPQGVKLIDGGVDDQGMKILVHFKFAFDDVSKLAQVQFPGDKGGSGGGMPGSKNPFQDLFGGLRVVDEGKTLLLTTTAVNPLKDEAKTPKPGTDAAAEPDPMAKQVEAMMKSFKVTFKIDSPFEVATTNATRRNGKTLYWEYNLDTFKDKAKQKVAEEGLLVRFKK